MSSIYNTVENLHPSRSLFNLSNEKKFTCDAGQVIPIFCRQMVPGDVFKYSPSIVLRDQPLVAPVMHGRTVYTSSYFVPYRLLCGETVEDDPQSTANKRVYEVAEKDFETFITGGTKGDGKLKGVEVTLPRWMPTGQTIVNDNWNGIPEGQTGSNASDVNVTTTDNGLYSLWDYLGFPIGVKPNGASPLAFPKRAYNFIWNNVFRNQNLESEVDIDSDIILQCHWKQDYFTSALPWLQRGTAPALPIDITNTLAFDGTFVGNPSPVVASTSNGYTVPNLEVFTQDGGTVKTNVSGSPYFYSANRKLTVTPDGTITGGLTGGISATTFNIATLRLCFQIQRWLERNARSGVRYTSFLRSHFGVAPTDERLQRPEFVGGTKQPILVSEVVQTSASEAGSTGSKQGNLSGHGICASDNDTVTYHAQEFGIFMTLMYIKPESDYSQGIEREWLYRTKYDFYFPEFSHLSEQAIEIAEIYATDNGNVDENGDPVVFGYQGRYDELRASRNIVCGGMQSTFDYWHLARKFSNQPELNEDFVKCRPSKRIYAVQNEPTMIVTVGNSCEAYRPLPIYATPGMIDHD